VRGRKCCGGYVIKRVSGERWSVGRVGQPEGFRVGLAGEVFGVAVKGPGSSGGSRCIGETPLVGPRV